MLYEVYSLRTIIKIDYVCFNEQYGGLDPNGTGLLNQEEHFSEIFKEYEQQCRV